MSEILESYVAGRWTKGTGPGREVLDAVTGETVTHVSSEGIDMGEVVRHAREVGGPALRGMTFPERAAALKAAAGAVDAGKDELYALSARAGSTAKDCGVDVDGGAGTAFAYSSMGRKGLPDGTVIVEDDITPLGKTGAFGGRHVLTTPHGVALQINAFNFPVWGMMEKLAPALLAGVPTIVKPATPTAYVAVAAARLMIESGALPEGSLQIVAGSISGLMDELGGQDHVGFTGSADTAATLRGHDAVTRRSVHFNAEADSLNASVLGPDAVPGEPEFDLFVKGLVTEMTTKAGQKCTAIRRALVPADRMDDVADAVAAKLEGVTVGAPRSEGVRMGALVGTEQRDDVRAAAAEIASAGKVVFGDLEQVEVVDADAQQGAFMSPFLVRVDDADRPEPHTVEAFGPVSALLPYRDADHAVELLARGEGSLAGSVVSADADFVSKVVAGAAPYHGRILVLDRDSAAESTGHGIPMPQLVHGGPGRAGGGQEEGGLRAVHGHMQRTAVQGGPAVLEALGS